MTPTELGVLFLKYYPVNEQGYSPIAIMDDLEQIDLGFRTTNGCQWARTDQSWLGKQFDIQRVKKGNRVFSVQLVGFKAQNSVDRAIPAQVRKNLEKRCVVLDTTTQIEIDHKDGRYSAPAKEVNDFQGLHKTVNDAKRQHCKRCRESGNRFDARVLGSSISFTKGNPHSKFCEGCYWYDPVAFWQETTKYYPLEGKE